MQFFFFLNEKANQKKKNMHTSTTLRIIKISCLGENIVAHTARTQHNPRAHTIQKHKKKKKKPRKNKGGDECKRER